LRKINVVVRRGVSYPWALVLRRTRKVRRLRNYFGAVAIIHGKRKLEIMFSMFAFGIRRVRRSACKHAGARVSRTKYSHDRIALVQNNE